MKEIPNTGMAVCTDRGDSLDVHPTRKQEVGERLAYWALNKTYGHHVVPSGPLYKSVAFNKNVAIVSFDYAEGLKAAEDGEELKTFEVAGEDQIFYPAKAVVEGNQIKVWTEKVKEPKIVRYGWQPFTRANLVNGAGLPASTFRSDVE
jgi:sialate O-acetylesterase